MRSSLLALALLVVSCGGGTTTQVHFTRATGVPTAARAVGAARFVGAGDMAALYAVGARVVGVIRVESHQVGDVDLRGRVAVSAARAGGTHVREVDTHEAPYARTVEEPSVESRIGLDVNYPPGQAPSALGATTTVDTDVTTFEVYAVPRPRWPELPIELRP